jgi:hypothetical protein
MADSVMHKSIRLLVQCFFTGTVSVKIFLLNYPHLGDFNLISLFGARFIESKDQSFFHFQENERYNNP